MTRAVALLALSTTAHASPVVINELLPDPDGADAGHEWIELYNVSGATVDLEDWSLEKSLRQSAGWSEIHAFAGVSIPAGGFLVVGEPEVGFADVTVDSLALGNGSGGDGLRLHDDTWTIVDQVVYGPDNSDGIDDLWGVVPDDQVAPNPASGRSLARIPDGVVSGDYSLDFQLRDPTPGASNQAPPPDCDTGDVVVNEFLPDPAGADGDAKAEWVELYAASAVDLTGWSIEIASKADNHKVVATFDGETLSAGGRLVVGEANAPADVFVETLGLYSGSGGDAVRLVDCAGEVVDTVVYGGTNEDALPDDSGAPATSVAPKPGADQSLARRTDGRDTDRSGDDFHVLDTPTPGAPNPEPPACTPSTGSVKINELLPDPAGADADAGTEFVELYNTGGGTVDLGGWSIVAAGKDDDWTPDFVFQAGQGVHPEGFVVVGGPNVAGAIVSDIAIPNGSGGDVVRLLDCEGTLVDAVVYGDDNADGITDESGAVATPVAKPGSDVSLARLDDGVDTDGPDDWFADATPTPGATNFSETADPGPGGGGGGAGAGGCGDRGAPSADAPGGGCSTVPGTRGMLALLALVGMGFRRRR